MKKVGRVENRERWDRAGLAVGIEGKRERKEVRCRRR